MEKCDNTKERILQTALQLFNQCRATNVSTVQIAAELGMSAGNLYYHFSNKEHIIRTIWQEMIVPAMDEIMYNPDYRLSENGVMQYYIALGHNKYRYRFFYSEIGTLLYNDPELKQLYDARAEKLQAENHELISTLVRVGILQQMEPEDVAYLCENTWVLCQTWVVYRLLKEEDVPEERFAFDMFLSIYHVLKPFFTPPAVQRMETLIELAQSGRQRA
ncbi:TetR/AcrR family transcriptional regulator [Ruminococcaceae bacterium OttesenSCG-928-O06]|nr:TetR/AcrR family transcriptional regulator [Ruminococcaceae bacterium OttesenSCG-928-O06]